MRSCWCCCIFWIRNKSLDPDSRREDYTEVWIWGGGFIGCHCRSWPTNSPSSLPIPVWLPLNLQVMELLSFPFFTFSAISLWLQQHISLDYSNPCYNPNLQTLTIIFSLSLWAPFNLWGKKIEFSPFPAPMRPFLYYPIDTEITDWDLNPGLLTSYITLS